MLKAVFFCYKYLVGPALHTLGGSGFGCRYYPTCSEYCNESMKRFGFLKAMQLSALRILRCNPWVKRDYIDLVPTYSGIKES